MPFFCVAGAGLVITVLSLTSMPKMRGHLARAAERRAGEKELSTLQIVRRPEVMLALAAPVTMMFSTFSLVPNLATYFQFNAGYPRDRLPLLYGIGGVLSFFVLRGVGALVDRYGPPRVAAIGTVFYLAVLYLGFIQRVAWIPVLVIFVSFMMSNNFRQVSMSTTSTRVPAPAERARFMSIQSAVQHMASAVAAAAASAVLIEMPDHSLGRMPVVATSAGVFALALPPLLLLIDRRVRARGKGPAAGAPVAASETPEKQASTS